MSYQWHSQRQGFFVAIRLTWIVIGTKKGRVKRRRRTRKQKNKNSYLLIAYRNEKKGRGYIGVTLNINISLTYINLSLTYWSRSKRVQVQSKLCWLICLCSSPRIVFNVYMFPRTTIVAKSYNELYPQGGYMIEAFSDFCSSCSWKERKFFFV